MFKPLLVLNVLLTAAAVAFSVQLVRTLATPHSLPPAPVLQSGKSVVLPEDNRASDRPSLAAYDVVARRNLFNPSRSEMGDQGTPLAPASKPVLYGVVIDGETRRAYMEDSASKRVSAYRIGDWVAGGQLERIEQDSVVIKLSQGPFKVMLNDPNKPKPVVSAPPPPQAVHPAPVPPRQVETSPSVPGVRPSGGGAFR